MSGGGSSKTHNEQIRKQFEMDTKNYNFNWATQADIDASLADNDPLKPETLKNDIKDIGQAWKRFDYATEGLNIRKANDTLNRNYQMETANKNRDYSISQQDHIFNEQTKAYNKSEETYGKQLAFNEAEMGFAMEREDMVLDEQFIDVAFQNQRLVTDLYEAIGISGYDKAGKLLGLQDTEGKLGFEETSAMTKLKQDMEGSKFSTAQKQLDMSGKAGEAIYGKAVAEQELLNKDGLSQFDKYALGLGVKESKTKADFENDIIRREVSNAKSKAAFSTTEANVEALKKLGTAQAGQSGRSSGKAIQSFLAEVGRMNTATVDSMVRGDSMAVARQKQNSRSVLNTTEKANIAKNKIDFAVGDVVRRTDLKTKEIDRDFKISDQKGELDLEEIRKQVMDAMDNTDLTRTELSRNLSTAQTQTGFDMKRTDWDLGNYGSRFKTNQEVLQAQLDSAAKASALNKKDIIVAKMGSDMRADANRMIQPTRLPTPPEITDLPIATYQDPMFPDKPPEPIKGAMAGSNQVANIAGAGIAGVGTYAALAAVAPQVAIPLAVATAAFSLFD